MKKITIATVKSFIRKNKTTMQINVKSKFDGMCDGVNQKHGGFVRALSIDYHTDNNFGIAGAWFVGRGNDYLTKFENENMIGIEVYNSCGSFVLATKKPV